jgi:hypothetical protein
MLAELASDVQPDSEVMQADTRQEKGAREERKYSENILRTTRPA